MKAGPIGWVVTRHRRSIAMAVSGWMFLSLVLAFWPCCQAVADEHPPAVSMEVGDHDHGGMPSGTDDPCRTWLDTADAALNTSPDALISDSEPGIWHAIYADSHDFPAIAPSAPDRQLYHASPPGSLPLYLRTQHLLI